MHLLKQLLLLSFLILSNISYSQYYKRTHLDSLKKVLDQQKGTEQINTLLDLGRAYLSFQLDTALLYANLAREKSLQENYDWGTCKSLYCQALIEKEFKKTSEVLPILKKCSDWFTKNGYEKDGIASQLTYEQVLFMNQGQEIAYELALKTHKRVEKINDPTLLGISWFQLQQFKPNLVESENYKGSYDSAMYYFQMTTDSLRIISTYLYKQMKVNGATLDFNYLYKTKKRVEKWGNIKLLYATNWFLEIAYLNSYRLDSVLHYHEKSSDLAKIYYSDSSRMGDPRILGYAYYFVDSLDLSLKYFNQSLDRTKKFEINSDMSGLLRAFGEVEIRSGDYKSAVETFLEVVDLARKKRNDVDLYNVKIRLAELYTLLEEYEKSEDICLETISWADSALTGEPKEATLFSAYLQLGNTFNSKGDYQNALKNYEKSKKFKKDDIRAQFSFEGDLGIFTAYLNQQDTANASTQYKEIIERYPASLYIYNAIFQLQKGRLLLIKEDYYAAINALEAYFEFSINRSLSRDQKDANFYLYQAYNAIEKKGKALENYIQYANSKDSLNIGRNLADVQKIQSDYELSLKESEIQQLEQLQEISDLKLIQQKNELSLGRVYIALLIVAFLLLIVVAYIIVRRIRYGKEEEKKALEIKNLKAQQKIELAEVKNSLYANISHEFKTPLTLIRVPLIDYRSKVPDDDKTVFDSIVKNTDHLLEMLDELLGVSKIESGTVKMDASTFNLAKLLSQIKLNFAPLFSQKKIQLEWITHLDDDHFYGDESKLNIVINNLLKNAFSNTAENGWVKCEIALNKELCICVSNKGEQIAQKDLPHIFERFYRASDSNYSGTGIGLAWSKQIAELHNGTIDVDNSKQGQVSFSVQIPAVTHSEIIPKKHVENGVEIVKNGLEKHTSNQDLPHVLVVEDNAEMRELLHTILKDDFKLNFAENGQIGEEMAIQLQPDLIISDVMMPEKDGFELLKTLKENFNSSHIPVILLTARTDSASHVIGLNQDADDYIKKPFDPTELKARVNNLLRQRVHLHKLFSENPLLYSKEIKCTPIDAEFVDRARKVLDVHYADGDFSVSTFCRELALNRTSVNQKLKALANQSIAEYIRNFRLEKASQLLIETDTSIVEIATDTGFNNPQSFNKAFKKKFNCTPSVFRSKKGARL